MREMGVPGSEFGQRAESGQMAVEMAVVLPVILVVLVIAIDCMVFVSECARFDNIAPQETLACAVSPKRGNYAEERRVQVVKKRLSKAFNRNGEKVTVKSRDPGLAYAGIRVYDFELSMAPWPLGRAGKKVFGVKVPKLLKHSYSFAFDPYTPGQLL